jgi:hypothetical protein
LDWRAKVVLFEQIRRKYEFGVGTIAGVAQKLGVHRRIVREAIGSALPKPRKKTERLRWKLQAAVEFVDAVLEADRKAPRKQRHTAHRIPAGAAQNQVCDTRITGDVQFQNNGPAVEIGSASPTCAGNTIGGDLSVQMLRGVLAGRTIATADVPAFRATPQMQPPPASREAVRTALAARRHIRVDSVAIGFHRRFLLALALR